MNRKPYGLFLEALVLVALLFLLPVNSAAGQAPRGYYRGPTTSLPDSLLEVRKGGRFRISIMRTPGDSLERELISRAESLFPLRDLIETAAEGETRPGTIQALQEAREKLGNRWWWRSWDFCWLPFALTGAAVDHYIERVRYWSEQPNPFLEWNPGIDHSAGVEYTASVESALQGVEADHSVVHLDVRFEFYCGPLCALLFTHSRSVEFDGLGRVVSVVGDGIPDYRVR